MVTDEYCLAEAGLPCLSSSATACGSMLYNNCCVFFCSIISSWVLSPTNASKCFEYFSICHVHVHITNYYRFDLLLTNQSLHSLRSE